jgi:hypothetical protein
MRIKDPLLVNYVMTKVYIVDVEGKKVEAIYHYDMENEQLSGWQYDLEPCFVDLTEEEIQDLEDEFYEVLCEIKDEAKAQEIDDNSWRP